MKKSILVLSIVILAMTYMLGACKSPIQSSPTPDSIAETSTSDPIPPSPVPTDTLTPVPTDTPIPTDTPTETPAPTETLAPTATPTETPEPTNTPQPVTVGQLVEILRDYGYTRQPFKGIGQYTDLRPGQTGYVYSGDNWLEPIKVYEDGYVRFEVLNNLDTRASRMELKLEMLDQLFPEEFMAELRQAQGAYLETVGRSVSGTAAQVWLPPAQDPWSSLEGQYNVSNTTIGAYEVTFSLWFWQIECPEGYICWFPSFGDQVFLGQSSFVFYNIELQIAP